MRYEIKGGAFPIVVCNLESGEKMITERGSMVWMSPNMQMETRGGGLGKMFAKAFAGESMFQNIYTARGAGMITFGSSFPGQIKAINIGPGQEMIVQKSAFLASEAGVELSIHFKKKLGVGFFGGEGFIMQRLSGNGVAFVEIDGELVEYDLQPGEQLVVDTGNRLAVDAYAHGHHPFVCVGQVCPRLDLSDACVSLGHHGGLVLQPAVGILDPGLRRDAHLVGGA